MRILIAGGSMAGLFAAALLRQAGHDVHVFERSRAGLEGRGAGLVVQPEVQALLDRVGLAEAASVGVMARDRITLARDGQILQRDPHPQMQMSWDHLYLAMRGLIDADRYHRGSGVRRAGADSALAWIELEDGRRFEGDLVIGADGIGSAVREAVVGTAIAPSYSGYVAWRALLPEAALPEAARGLSDRFAFFHMPGGQVLGYTVTGPGGEQTPGQRRYNCVWYRVAPLAEALRDAEGQLRPYSLAPGQVAPAASARLKADAAALLPPPFAAVIGAEPRPFVQAIFDLEVPHMANDRLALIGDAAFVARPHTAMGVAKAAGDAFALAAAIEQGWTPEARAEFERARIAMGRAITAYGRRLGRSILP